MSEKTVKPADPNTLIKVHQANYGVFQARTEKEVNQAIQNALQSCQYVTAYYLVNASGLEKLFTYNPATKRAIKAAPTQIEMIPTEIVKHFSLEARVTMLEEAGLPETITEFIAGTGCNQLALLPIMEDVEILGVLFVGAQPEQVIDSETINPLVHLSEIIPVALNNVKAARAIKQRLRELEAISETSQTI